jgi:hypothetical protein
MKLAKVLVVFKKSTLQLQALEYKEPRFLKLLEEGHASVAKVKNAHEQHVGTLETVEKALTDRGILCTEQSLTKPLNISICL